MLVPEPLEHGPIVRTKVESRSHNRFLDKEERTPNLIWLIDCYSALTEKDPLVNPKSATRSEGVERGPAAKIRKRTYCERRTNSVQRPFMTKGRNAGRGARLSV